MYPLNSALDKTNCLASLIGVRTDCQPAGDFVPPFFIEDIEGFDVQQLAKLALPSAPKGADLARQAIGSAAREMMGDLELLMQNGYSLNNIVGSQCSSCTLLPVYTANTGIKIKSVVVSAYKKLQVTKLTILANVTATKELCLDDGENVKKFNVVLQAGIKMPVNLFYETLKDEVKIYFTDTTVGLGQVSCPTSSSCGCGGSSANTSPVNVSGLTGGVDSATQYGFIPCASVGCSYDTLVCSLINQTPNIFGLALLYKVGEKLTVIASQGIRNNETASFQEGTEGPLVREFGKLYWAKLQGGNNRKGIKNIVNDFLRRQSSDRCITCETKFSTAGVTG